MWQQVFTGQPAALRVPRTRPHRVVRSGYRAEKPEHFRLSIWDVGSGPQGSWVPQVGVAGRCHGPAGSGRLARRRGQTAGAPGG